MPYVPIPSSCCPRGRCRRLSTGAMVMLRQVMAAYLAHIARVNPGSNAIVAMRDEAAPMAEAAAADEALAAAAPQAGCTACRKAPKDLVMTRAASAPPSASPICKDNVPASDGVVVERAPRRAVWSAKTNTPEFRAGLTKPFSPVFHGATLNPYGATRAAGGGSGGAAAAHWRCACCTRGGRQRLWRLAAQPGRLLQRIRLPALGGPRALRPHAGTVPTAARLRRADGTHGGGPALLLATQAPTPRTAGASSRPGAGLAPAGERHGRAARRPERQTRGVAG